jgi:2-oxoglutarate dehydrogenase E1 component
MCADAFERFLADKFPASKRFGLEGCEAIIPAIHALVADAAAAGISRIEIGMAHRGRLSLLHNVLRKPLGALCAEMQGYRSDFRVGDVQYHLGQSTKHRIVLGDTSRDIMVTVAPNPSHLEMCMPVVQGLVRSLQRHR